ncbi:MAG: flagellar hook protein FlgE [Phenylobacterium sp.]|uniref:flagellar hook protein FlgE n=1 Tax=Phenylobacterium sp. TaxID=1871053 RepID=UPI00391ADDD4
MSLSSALSSAVSGLSAQGVALSAISENIANSSTTAYKTKETSFQTLLTGYSSSSSSSSGVVAKAMQAMAANGTVTSTSESTNLAITGAGFFVVAADTADQAAAYAYTRDGSFSADADGYLVNDQGYYLLGFPTDADGNITAANTSTLTSLEPINVDSISGAAKATTTVSMSANLPADAEVGDSFASSMEVIDSLGVSHTVNQTWTKTAANTWTLSLDDPFATAGGDSAVASGTISPATVDVTFDTDGVLASTSPSPVELTIGGFTTGAADNTFTLDLGEVGGTDGLTQKASTTTPATIENTQVEQDGARYGQLSGLSIDSDGLVTASFDNGLSVAIARIPIATFSNPSGLTQISGTIYDENQAAGRVTLSMPGSSGAGSLTASALEGSTTDTATEFNKMIIAQQAYSAASQVVSTVGDMFDTLIQAVR